jgi:cytochrome c
MTTHWVLTTLSLTILVLTVSANARAEGDPRRGAQVFQACAACHSLEPGQHLTGPSLASAFGRKAGTVEDFQRYSRALKESGVLWNEKNLDAWVQNPAALIPRNTMIFRGLPDARARDDLIAYLKAVSEGKAAAVRGMMAPQLADLKKAGADSVVKAIRYCGDAYHVTTGDGETVQIWEFNLRIKTDSSKRGPAKGQPVLVGAGMAGDRAQLVFSHPGEIPAFVKARCD